MDLPTDDDSFMRSLYRLDMDTHRDIPTAVRWADAPYEEWLEVYVNGPGAVPSLGLGCPAWEGTRRTGSPSIVWRWHCWKCLHRCQQTSPRERDCPSTEIPYCEVVPGKSRARGLHWERC